MNPRVWFKSISLENVRSFGTKQTINFTDKDGNAAQWNVILGDNGTGKTTVLNGIIVASGLAEFFNLKLERFLRSKTTFMYFKCYFEKVYQNKSKITEISKSFNWDEIKSRIEPKNISTADIINIQGLVVAGYGASRVISTSSFNEENNYTVTFIDEFFELINAEEWLIRSEYISLKEFKFKNRYDIVIRILKKLFREEASDIYIDTETGVPKVFFKTHYGDVRLHELSLGYKTLIAWMVDFAKGLLDRYPDSENPLAEPAVCLVDEIDLHLHPKFQRNIIKFLTDTFPNTQFIVTAHSPLIVVAAEERPLNANIILLKREDDQTVVVNDPVDVSKWSVDQILNSDLFGYVPPRSEQLTELRTERDALLGKSKLTKKEQVRLTELDNKIGFIPFGRDQAEIKAETIIQQLADVLRSKQGSQ